MWNRRLRCYNRRSPWRYGAVAKLSFNLKAPCRDCPFRSDIRPYLPQSTSRTVRPRSRTHDLRLPRDRSLSATQRQARPFQPSNSASLHRRLILMHKTECQGDLQQLAERLEFYDRGELRMDAPVYDTFEQMIKAQKE